MSQGPISRKVTLPSGALGVVFEAGSTKINQLREGSPLLGHVQPGERVVAFTREDGSMIECTGMSDAALAHELKQTVHQSGRIITVVAAGGASVAGPKLPGDAPPVGAPDSDDERVTSAVVAWTKCCICNIIVASSIISFAILSGNGRAERALYDMAAKTWVHGDCEVVGIVFERYKNDKLKESVTENGGRRLLAAGATWHAVLQVQRLKQHGLDSPLGFRVLDETERFGQIYLGRVDAEAPELGQLDAEALKELEEAAAATTEELEAAAMTEEPDAVFSLARLSRALCKSGRRRARRTTNCRTAAARTTTSRDGSCMGTVRATAAILERPGRSRSRSDGRASTRTASGTRPTAIPTR